MLVLGGTPLAGQSPAQQPTASLAPLGFLAGSCWRGTFGDGKGTDEHCFDWVFNRRFLRDRHLVLGRGEPYRGETWYFVDRARGAVGFHYYNSQGALTFGAVETAGDTLVFPEKIVTELGTRELRTLWTRPAPARYEVWVQEQAGDGWRTLWHMELARQASWNAAVAR